MLARLLALHPDIINERPLDYRSDIWSLGKAFVEILGADPDVESLQDRVNTLPVPPEIQALIRLMLSDDPDLRPRSMAEVAATLEQLSDKAIQVAADRLEEATGGTTRGLAATRKPPSGSAGSAAWRADRCWGRTVVHSDFHAPGQ